MSLIDGLLLGAILALAAWRMAAPRRHPRARALLGLAIAALAVGQVFAEGVYWQFLTGYLLLAAAVTPGFGRGRLVAILSVVVLAGLALAAVGPWVLLPVPRLPDPGGPYAVGAEVYRWVDASRPEPTDAAQRRNVVVQAWYPAAPSATGSNAANARLPYIDAADRLPPRVSVLPGFVLRHFDRVDTHAVAAAPVSPDRPVWPVVIFSPGYGATRAAYTGLVTRLAAKGFVVLALDHPYESAVVQLADGRVAPSVEHFLPGDPDRIGFMQGRLAVRVADVRFVLDRLGQPGALGPRLDRRLDLAHVAVIGHSFGGATAATALDQDPRVQAAANLDGTLYGPVIGRRLPRPFLLLDSDRRDTHHSDAYVRENQRLLDGLAMGGAHFSILHANHYSFTDVPMFFSPPGRWLLTRLIGGARGPVETQAASADILAAFLAGPLTGVPADVAAAAARYRDITGGPVPPAAP